MAISTWPWEGLEKKVYPNEDKDDLIKKWIKNVEWIIENKEINELINNWTVSKDQISAIWMDNIYKITPDKITVIGYMLSHEDIKKIWVEILIRMSIEELNAETIKYM